MNRSKLKSYAPQARRDFIQAMKGRAAFYGLTATKVEPLVERGDVVVIAGREHPRAVGRKRNLLEERTRRDGFEQTMEAMAYTWFNRLVAIRFMELHGYLDHGYRVLSHPDGKSMPEILEYADAEQVRLPGLKRDRIIDLKQAGNKDSELYRLLLTAQCNALHAAMPFLFERIDDETELLLPDNLLHSDSLIRRLVSEIDEEDWTEVEIIGWLYQFYVSEKKDQVIGKVVASEDIPAATQLFTPNWIVKYLVQNTLGRQWLATYPNSSLRGKMEFYIEPAEQTQEVQDQLRAITPASLNPEELTLLDPACGSGHILVEAFDLFKAIYEERGYRAREIPALILQKNLFGLEIDDRAAQLASFALMMKARANDPRVFAKQAKPNILAFVESKGLDAASITNALNAPIEKDKTPKKYLFEEIEDAETPLLSRKVLAEKGHVPKDDIASLLALFENAKTFGSLIQIPPELAAKLPEIEDRVGEALAHGNLEHTPVREIQPLLEQAWCLAAHYDAVVANPPYMGSKGMNPCLKDYAQRAYPASKPQLFSMFIERGFLFAKSRTGAVSMVTLDNWLSAVTYADFRKDVLNSSAIHCLLHMPYEGRGKTPMGIAFGTTASVFRTVRVNEYKSHVACARYFELDDDGCPIVFPPANDRLGARCLDASLHIAGYPILYWASEQILRLFAERKTVGECVDTREGMATADNDRFVRFWYEVPFDNIGVGCESNSQAINSKRRWFSYVKGGDYRKWSGNTLNIVNWENDGAEIKENIDPLSGRTRSHNYNGEFAFRSGITWTGLSSSKLSVRFVPVGFMFDAKGPMAFAKHDGNELLAMAILNSVVGFHLMKMLAPTLDFKLGHIMSVPCELSQQGGEIVTTNAKECVELSSAAWDSNEVSVGFQQCPIIAPPAVMVSASVARWNTELRAIRNRMSVLEELNNKVILREYLLDGELSPAIADEDITVSIPDFGDVIRRLLSYGIGCMMGRYSLDEPGLIYAQSGNKGFDPGRYKKLPADDDGIVPLYETDWGVRDDAANRVVDFIGVAWPKEHLEDNLKFVADCLGPPNGEQPRDTIRRYLATGFYKHHLAMYKKRPIYWLFSSGKERAFQCLVYLHRYHEGTLARMRTEYVIPLQGQIPARIDKLEGDKAKATSTSHRRKLQKKQDDLKKQQAELAVFDDKLKHAADQKIALDLDDGVKVNYGKFGDLVAEAKAITGAKDDE